MSYQGKSRKPVWPVAAAFLIPCCGLLILMAFCGYRPFGTKTAMLYSDCYHQYYPFFVAFRRTLRTGGSLLYNWEIGMGVDYLGLIAYYLGSPLNLLSVLVPDSWVLNYFCLLVPLKLGFAGMFFALMLRGLSDRADLSTALFGSMYGLCAWALGYQWNVMWLDSFALLPLVMLGFVRMLRDRKILLYALSLALSVATNYYIGLFTCYFVFLMFFCYEICRWQGFRRFLGDLVCIGFVSVLALGMTSVVTLTALASLQTTQSSVNVFPTGFRLNIASTHDLAGLLDAMRQCAGNLGGGQELSFKEGLPNLFCGVGTLLLAFLYLLDGSRKRRDRICALVLLLFFLVSFPIRQLDFIWHGFHFPNMIPYRFSFLFSFVLLYMAYEAWLQRRQFHILQVCAAGCLTGMVLACSGNLLHTESFSVGSHSWDVPVYLLWNAGFLAVYLLTMALSAWRFRLKEHSDAGYAVLRRKYRRRRSSTRIAFNVFLGTEIMCTVINFGCWFPGTNVSNYPRGTESAASVIRVMQEREEDGQFYRAETAHSQTLNDGALNGYAGISAFTSSANVHITQFLQALGYGAKNTYNRYCFEESSPVANLFLDLKYLIERDGGDKTSSVFTELNHFGTAAVYENEAWLPLGFLTNIELGDLDFLGSGDSFDFQNRLFSAATGLNSDVWYVLPMRDCEVSGSGTTVSDIRASGFCSYSEPESGAYVVYSFRADRDGFACVRVDFPKRNDFYVSVNGTELYRETISLPQMLAIRDVQAGDIIDIRVVCKSGEAGTLNVNVAIMDNDLFRQGYEYLSRCPMTITSFTDTYLTAGVSCDRSGLLYTSIPQNGNWRVYVDGEEVSPVLVGECMLGVYLSEGEHSLAFRYRNDAFRLAAALSCACASLLALIVVIGHLRAGRKAAIPEPMPSPEPIPEPTPELPSAESPEPPAENSD